MFCLKEKVVYPGHGVAQVNSFIERTIGNQRVTFYELTFLNKDVTVLVPTQNAETIGLRALCSSDYIKKAFQLFNYSGKRKEILEYVTINWNKRNKEYQSKLRTGSLKDLLEIYRDLRFMSGQKELSFGEKNLLQQTEALLVEEIALVEKITQEKTIEQLRSLCSIHSQMKNSNTQNVAV